MVAGRGGRGCAPAQSSRVINNRRAARISVHVDGHDAYLARADANVASDRAHGNECEVRQADPWRDVCVCDVRRARGGVHDPWAGEDARDYDVQ